MGLRFRKSIKIAPGVKVNLNKNSASVSIGTKGKHYTVNSNGKTTKTVGIPGTGLSYSTTSGGGNKKTPNKSKSTAVSKNRESKKKNGCSGCLTSFLVVFGLLFILFMIIPSGNKKDDTKTQPPTASNSIQDNTIDSGISETEEDISQINAEQVEQERIATEQAEMERIAQEQVEAERIAAEQTSQTQSYDNASQQQTTNSYVLNTNTMKFHSPGCKSVKEIAPQNYSTYDGTRDDIINQGYSPCGNCKP